MNAAIQKTENTMLVKFEEVELNVQEDRTHEWLLETSLVAQGYGVTDKAIHNHKQRKSSELIEGKHWCTQTVYTSGGPQTTIKWTKRGVVRLGFGMHGERAKKFRDWAEDLVVEKMDAAIATISDDEIMSRALVLATNKLQSLEAKIEKDRPKVVYVDELLNTDDCVLTTVIATEIGVSAQRLNRILDYLQIQRKVRDTWVLNTPYANRGYTKMETHTFVKPDGNMGVNEQTVWTQRGRAFLRWMFYIKPEIRMLGKRQSTNKVYTPNHLEIEQHLDPED